jgi:hypothetical protein
MSATDAFETALLQHIFNNSAAANVGDATGLLGSGTAGSFYISLHTADPGETGNQTTSEAAYTSYARVAVARSSAGFTISGNSASNAALVALPAATGGSSTVTHFGVGSASSGAGNLFFSGALSASLAVTSGITPQFAIGALVINLD